MRPYLLQLWSSVFLFFSRLSKLKSRSCRNPERKDAPKLKIDRETTYVTGPLDKDGNVDYPAVLTELLGKGVSPENNANVLLIRAVGPGSRDQKAAEFQKLLADYYKKLGMDWSESGDRPAEYYKKLGIEKPPERGDYFVDLHDYLKKNVKLEPVKLAEKEAELNRALLRPWTSKSHPVAAVWLKTNEKPLALVIEAGKRSRYFAPVHAPEDTFYTADAPQYELIINNDAAKKKGVSIGKALEFLNIVLDSPSFDGGNLNLISGFHKVRLPEDLENLFVKNDRDEVVPFTEFMEVKMKPGLNRIANALVIRAMLQLGEKRWNDAWSDLLACHRLARVIGSSPTLLENSTAMAIDAIAGRGDLVFIDRADIDAKQFLQCMNDLQALAPLPSIANSFERGERLLMLDLAAKARKDGFSRLYQLYLLGEKKHVVAFDKQYIAEKMGLETLGLLDDVDWNPIFRECNRSIDEIVAILREKDRAKREKSLQMFEEKQKTNDKTKADDLLMRLKGMTSVEKTKFLLRSFNPRVEGIRAIQLAADRGEQMRRNLQIAFALAAYRRAEGKYPQSLEPLVPKYLARVPTDYFSDKPLTYRLTEKGYELRSNANGKNDGPKLDEGQPLEFPNIRMPVAEQKSKR